MPTLWMVERVEEGTAYVVPIKTKLVTEETT